VVLGPGVMAGALQQIDLIEGRLAGLNLEASCVWCVKRVMMLVEVQGRFEWRLLMGLLNRVSKERK
jgi:hypothetical protein